MSCLRAVVILSLVPLAVPVAARAEEHAAAPSARLRARLDRGGAPAREVAAWVGPDGTSGFLTVAGERGSWTSPIYPMWSAHAGDLDGDGRDEIVLGVWARRRRHAEPDPHRAAWVLRWDGRALVEAWRGTALARPLRDLAVADLDGDGTAELLALETTTNGCVLCAYRWTGFGFAGLERRPTRCERAVNETLEATWKRRR